MKKLLIYFFLSFTLTFTITNAQPVIDGIFDGEGVWGAPKATADGVAGWAGVNAQNLYVTYDETYVYLSATMTGASVWQGFCFVFNTKEGGAVSDSWLRQVFYDYTAKPDFDIRGRFDNIWGEIHTWTGAAWTGYVNITNSEFKVADDICYVEARIPKATLENAAIGDIQFYITGDNNEHGSFDAIPDDDNSTGWIPPQSTSNMLNILTNIPLPVELTSFTGFNKNGNVILNWATASETNNKGFEVEKSINKVTWNNIGFVEGNGNSNSAKHYSFTDKNVTGKTYYRLIQTNYDGSSKTYDAIEVGGNVPSAFTLNQNYPNPFNPSTVISFSVPKRSYVSVKVFNVLGNEVKELVNETKEPGTYNVSFNAAGLNSGVYFCTFKGDGYSATKKMMLIK